MRKLTGYIGAMIIVFALAGSILAGYALNLNSTTAVINEYETVTDVSGLYTHSDEKRYIEYNPASNYVNYKINESDSFTVNNTSRYSGLYYMRMIGDDNGLPTIKWNTSTKSTGSVFKNDVEVTNTTLTDHNNLPIWYIFTGENIDVFRTFPGDTSTGEIKIEAHTVNNGDVTYWSNDIEFYFSATNNLHVILYDRGVNFDVYCQILFVPDESTDAIYSPFDWGETAYYQYSNRAYYKGTATITQLSTWDGQPVLNFYSITPGQSSVAFVLKTVIYETSGLGILYTESNRVNNYPVLNSPENTVTKTDTIDLMNISAGDVWPTDVNFKKTWQIAIWTTGEWPQYSYSAPYYATTSQSSDDRSKLHAYRLSDILNTYTIPLGAQYLKITSDSSDIRNYTDVDVDVNIDCNIVGFSDLSDLLTVRYSNDCVADHKDYLIYDLSTGVCSVYSYNGVLKYSNTPSNIAVLFCDNTLNYGWSVDVYTGGHTSVAYSMQSRARPFIKITATIYNPADIDYIDVTKGFEIKPTNQTSTIWDNKYENGDIKLLFRAAATTNTYGNTLTISNNVISVAYVNSNFYVKLNSDDWVNVGMWRNIVLDVDLQNGKLSAIPVRTFNSFTNVVLERTSIPIGNLSGASPTNTILWDPTTTSLMFNVYSTDVFMDTYNVVMVNPTLDITDYFTDLNGFYRLNLYNFATYGNTMTINGETMTVNNGTITYDDKTIELRDMYITYADGNVSIGDNHTSVDMGEITTTSISMTGAWYFLTDLERGYTSQKLIYDWDWGTFIFDNTQFCVFYLGFAVAALIVARKYCSLSIMDYTVLLISIVVALGVQVVA